jgi:hypothetical protein
MSVSRSERQVECHKCGKTFPVATITDADEAQQAADALEKGGGTVRVARWCPWCGETNMVELAVELVKDEVVFRGDLDKTLRGLPPQSPPQSEAR